jgi:hypothetical protein
MLNYTDITQNTYIQSWTVTEIMAIEKCGLLVVPCTVPHTGRDSHSLRLPALESNALLVNAVSFACAYEQ